MTATSEWIGRECRNRVLTSDTRLHPCCLRIHPRALMRCSILVLSSICSCQECTEGCWILVDPGRDCRRDRFETQQRSRWLGRCRGSEAPGQAGRLEGLGQVHNHWTVAGDLVFHQLLRLHRDMTTLGNMYVELLK